MKTIYTSDVPERSAVETLINLFNSLYADVLALRAAFNAHTHVENTAATYTQNASTATIVVGQQAPVLTSDQLTLKK